MARASQYTQNREKILRSVADAAHSHGRSPSVRQLAEQVGVGVATMHSYLQKLSEEGLIEWRPGRHRSIHLTPQGSQELS